MPTTPSDEEKIRARWQLALNLDTFIRESKLPEDEAGNLLNMLYIDHTNSPLATLVSDKPISEQQLKIDALAASLNF